MGQGQRSARWLAAGTACFFLAGCLSGTGDEESVSRFNLNAGARPDQVARQKESANSPIIAALQDRRSVLPSSGSFDQVAGAVLGAYSRSAEADLLSARLRAEAASKNWLPRIGPNIRLTSLSDIVSQLIVCLLYTSDAADEVARQKEAARSPIITDLQSRRSVLPRDGSFD